MVGWWGCLGPTAAAAVLLWLTACGAQDVGRGPSSKAADDNAIDDKIRRLNEELGQLHLLRQRNREARQLTESSKDELSEIRQLAKNAKTEAGKELKENTAAEGGESAGKGGEARESQGEGGEDKEGEGEGREDEGGAGEGEEEFTPMDLTCGICLLCFITFNMTLYYLVNWPDPDMRVYVWTVISTTISVFVAIFVFATTDLILMTLLGHSGEKGISLALLGFSELMVWFTILQFTVAAVSGALEEHPFDRLESVKEQKVDRMISFQSFATLLAHITGFAAINAGGCLQHMYPFDINAATRFAVPLVMWIFMLVVGRFAKVIRTGIKARVEEKRISSSYSSLGPPVEASFGETGSERELELFGSEGEPERELVDWCIDTWEEETCEVELDVAGLAVSFVLVQACRFSITGVMPNNLGIEEEGWRHSTMDSVILAACGAGFAVLCVLCVVAHHIQTTMSPEIISGSMQSTVKRMILTGRMSFAMAFAWCFFTAAKWEITRILPEFSPNGVVSRVLLAMAISVVVFVVILLLDRLADMESTGEVADGAIITMIYALATLVGFAFEQSFDGAVEALSDLCFTTHPLQAELVLATLVCLIVYPAWKKYILRTLWNAKEVQQETHKNKSMTHLSRSSTRRLSTERLG